MTIITCYCPCVGESPGSAYSQQLIYMADSKSIMPYNITCSKQLYGHDLKILTEDFLRKGHQLLVCDDFNSEYIYLKEWIIDVTLVDVIATKHGVGPRTYKQSKDSPIDCCFGTAVLKINKG